MSASTNRKTRQAAREAGTDKKSIAAQKAADEARKSNRRWTLGTIGVVLLIVIILLLNSGLIFLTPAYRVGDRTFSAAETNFYYGGQYNYFMNQYGSYASMFGIDTSNGLSGLATQDCSFSDGTWKDYFLDSAKGEMLQITALTDYAKANDIALDADEVAEVDKSFEGIDEAAKSYGYASGDNLLAANYGSGVDQKLARGCYLDSALANKALNTVSDSFVYTQEQLDERYASYEGARDVFNYAYYYVAADTVDVVGEDGETTQETTEDTMKEAEAKALAIMDAYGEAEGGSSVEKLNAAIDLILPGETAIEESRVEGSNLVAGSEWFMDGARKDGDITVEDSTDGYYVLVFIARDYNKYPMAQVRHILVKAEADADGNYTDEAKAAAKAQAEAILAEYQAGDKTEESFAALAEQYSEDAGSNTNGGLYDSVAKGQMVEEFDKFCFEGHKKGDTAIVYGESGSYAGYHVMYYVGEGDRYCDYLADSDLRAEDAEAWLEELKGGYECEECFGMKFVGK